MTKPITYYYGQILNDKGAMFIKDVPFTDKNSGRMAEFLCGECHKNTFIAPIAKVKHRGKFRCDECQAKHGYIRDESGKAVIDDLLNRKFGHLTVIQYLGSVSNSKHQLWLCQCDCGRICKVRGNNLKTGHTQTCGICHTSLGEDKIESILKKKNIQYKTQYSFPDCKRKRPLRFDFYLPLYNICIEYDGRQHFGIQNTWYEGHENEYYEQKERDTIKTQYCIDHGISLYRISYLEYDNIDNRMEEILKELNNGKV